MGELHKFGVKFAQGNGANVNFDAAAIYNTLLHAGVNVIDLQTTTTDKLECDDLPEKNTMSTTLADYMLTSKKALKTLHKYFNALVTGKTNTLRFTESNIDELPSTYTEFVANAANPWPKGVQLCKQFTAFRVDMIDPLM